MDRSSNDLGDDQNTITVEPPQPWDASLPSEQIAKKYLNPLMPNSDLYILLCLTLDDFTRQLKGDPLGTKGLKKARLKVHQTRP